MKKEVLELIRERLLKISDYESEIDILEYFICIEDFSRRVDCYKWLSSEVPAVYHNLTIGDFVSLSEEELSKIVKKSVKTVKKHRDAGKRALESVYSLQKYEESLNNDKIILQNLKLANNTELFANNVLQYMSKGDLFFNAGIALFHDDEEVQEAAKQYMNMRN